MSKKNLFSYYEEKQAWKFINMKLDMFAYGLEREECAGEAWKAYFEVRQYFEKDISDMDFWVYAGKKIELAITTQRKQKNEKYSHYSKISLYSELGEDGDELISLLPGKCGDFTNSVHFWMFINNMKSPQREICILLTQGEDASSIMERLHLNRAEYYENIIQIQQLLKDYQKDLW